MQPLFGFPLLKNLQSKKFATFWWWCSHFFIFRYWKFCNLKNLLQSLVFYCLHEIRNITNNLPDNRMSITGMLLLFPYVVERGKLKSVDRIEVFLHFFILHHFLIFHVICHSFGSYKTFIKNLNFKEFIWEFHIDKFIWISYTERHNSGK